MPAPEIVTDRLVLRSHRLDDLEACVAMWKDPRITRHTIGDPAPEQRTWTRLLAYLGHWELLGFGYWAVEEKASSRYIGDLGFADFKRDMQPPLKGIPELGWALAAHAHGRGYATEALTAVLEWADAHFGRIRTVCIISPENAPSLRVAQKLQYREVGRPTLNGVAEILFARTPAMDSSAPTKRL